MSNYCNYFLLHSQANVMLEYTYAEGQALLQSNHDVRFDSLVSLIAAPHILRPDNKADMYQCVAVVSSALALSQIAERSLAILASDLAFIKDQITVSEVNIARMHNYNVRLRAQEKSRQAKAAAMAAANGSSSSS